MDKRICSSEKWLNALRILYFKYKDIGDDGRIILCDDIFNMVIGKKYSMYWTKDIQKRLNNTSILEKYKFLKDNLWKNIMIFDDNIFFLNKIRDIYHECRKIDKTEKEILIRRKEVDDFYEKTRC